MIDYSKSFTERFNKEATVNTEWHLSTMDYADNLPTESGLYLVSDGKVFSIINFFKKGDVIDEETVGFLGIAKKTIALKNAFYSENSNGYPEETEGIMAWTKLPNNVSDFLNNAFKAN